MKLIEFMIHQWMLKQAGKDLERVCCHPAGQNSIKYATTTPVRHLPNLFFQG